MNKASHVRLPMRGFCALHSSAIFFHSRIMPIMSGYQWESVSLLFSIYFVNGLLYNLFLPSYSNLHIYIAPSYCFFWNAKKILPVGNNRTSVAWSFFPWISNSFAQCSSALIKAHSCLRSEIEYIKENEAFPSFLSYFSLPIPNSSAIIRTSYMRGAEGWSYLLRFPR